MKKLCVVSMSGGKDSTATALVAIEAGVDARFVFADTGHEHQMTYDYLEYLRGRLGIEIEVVRADFADKVIHKRDVVRGKWVNDGAVTAEQAEKICELLVPTANPFLDLCLWKGRFPSTRARFCSSELKHEPLDRRMIEIIKQGHEIESWQGVRADESLNRRDLPERERGEIYEIYRPILKWSAEQVFDFHAKHDVKPNPLYSLGMGRVGCMPCIHARKGELAEISKRFPEEIARVAAWEKIVSLVSKRGNSTFFHSKTDPTIATKNNDEITVESHGIDRIVEWSKTARGGRQGLLDLETEEESMCSSMYGLCE